MERFAFLRLTLVGLFVSIVSIACGQDPLLSVSGGPGKMLSWSGETMATTYSVKVFNPPSDHNALRFGVDGVLRRVNDQMSTYLKSSEISRFNESESTDWFDVSIETATVVRFAQDLSVMTDGAFDVTVGPLVNAWSFGPGARTQTVPSQETLDSLTRVIGYKKLEVRLESPALKKSDPGLKVDLSAIAKGHGVDRVVRYLNESGAENVFVEVGGEVGTSGDKAGQWWKVGIQVPDMIDNATMIAHSLSSDDGSDRCMATSGDYRNYYEVDGVRYSHTIDPRTARPVQHSLASVSVVSDSCMKADAWATALSVLGPEDGLKVARREGLSVLVASRGEDAFELVGTGTLAGYSTTTKSKVVRASQTTQSAASNSSALATVAFTVLAFAMILFAMAIGVIFGRRAISGSCGGLANTTNEDGSTSCSLCSNPADACKELRERMAEKSTASSGSEA